MSAPSHREPLEEERTALDVDRLRYLATKWLTPADEPVLSEGELAYGILALLDENATLRAENAELREALPASERGRSLRAELAAERRKVDRVRELHRSESNGVELACVDCGYPWSCPTIAALADESEAK